MFTSFHQRCKKLVPSFQRSCISVLNFLQAILDNAQIHNQTRCDIRTRRPLDIRQALHSRTTVQEIEEKSKMTVCVRFHFKIISKDGSKHHLKALPTILLSLNLFFIKLFLLLFFSFCRTEGGWFCGDPSTWPCCDPESRESGRESHGPTMKKKKKKKKKKTKKKTKKKRKKKKKTPSKHKSNTNYHPSDFSVALLDFSSSAVVGASHLGLAGLGFGIVAFANSAMQNAESTTSFLVLGFGGVRIAQENSDNTEKTSEVKTKTEQKKIDEGKCI
jgi:hypothetical protein